jgi:ABC-type amino acid transport substrate-binding protein
MINLFEKPMRGLFASVILASALDANALTVRLCTLDHPFPPFTMPDGKGQVQELLRLAGKEEAVTLENIFAPRLRCMAKFQSGEVDALISGYLPERLTLGAFPMIDDHVDDTKAVGTVRLNVYRLRGSRVDWDGKSFGGLNQGSVGIEVGLTAGQRLRALGVNVDEGAKTVEQNLEKLLLGRVQAVVALESDAKLIIAQRFSDKIEALPQPFEYTVIHLQVNRHFYSLHKNSIDKLWTAIRQTRESPAFQQYLKRPQRGGG